MSYELTKDDEGFIQYWEKYADLNKKWTFMIKKYLSQGLIFSLPVGIFFFMMGFKRRALVSHGDLITIMIALIVVAFGFTFIKGIIKVDQYEKHYQILKMRQKANEEEKRLKEKGN